MRNFRYVKAATVLGAVNLLQGNTNARPLSGGTDLVSQMKLGIMEPDMLVDLKAITGLDRIAASNYGLDIGALATLDDISRNRVVREKYPALFQAIEAAASPQLRNRGTISGNLAQGSRCWYYRGPFRCWLKHGEVCYAREGENAHHAIFGNGPCYTVHPSDPAPALIALGAQVNLAGIVERTMPLEELFTLPDTGNRKLTILQPGEIITLISLPAPAAGSKSIYLKAMERRVWSFALVSAAMHLVFRDKIVQEARVVLGGVAPRPWRLTQVEVFLHGQGLTPWTITQASEMAVAGAQPLGQNHYKVTLVKGLMTEALTNLSA